MTANDYRRQVELQICNDAKDYMEEFLTLGYVAIGMTGTLLAHYSPGIAYDWDQVATIDGVWINDAGVLLFEYTDTEGAIGKVVLEESVLNDVAYSWLAVVADREGITLPDMAAHYALAQPSAEEIRRDVLDYNAACMEGFDAIPRVARGVQTPLSSGKRQYAWDRILEITVWHEHNMFGFHLTRVLDGVSDVDGVDCEVARAIFNDFGQSVLDKAMKDFLGIDPNNPDEADFVPVCNARL